MNFTNQLPLVKMLPSKYLRKAILNVALLCQGQMDLWLNTTESRGTCMFSTMYGKTAQLKSNCTINTVKPVV